VVILEALNTVAKDAAAVAEAFADKILAALNQRYQLGDAAHYSTPPASA
jgi:hypothetical protein